MGAWQPRPLLSTSSGIVVAGMKSHVCADKDLASYWSSPTLCCTLRRQRWERQDPGPWRVCVIDAVMAGKGAESESPREPANSQERRPEWAAGSPGCQAQRHEAEGWSEVQGSRCPAGGSREQRVEGRPETQARMHPRSHEHFTVAGESLGNFNLEKGMVWWGFRKSQGRMDWRWRPVVITKCGDGLETDLRQSVKVCGLYIKTEDQVFSKA